MALRRYEPPKAKKDRQRINEMIRVPQVRVVAEEEDGDKQLGILDTADALNMARSTGLDLVEVAPDSKPPVCRIMDYGKFKYQQKKRSSKQHVHQTKLKEVWLHPKTGANDLMVKANKAKEFLANKDKVQITVKFRGRELAHIDEGTKVLKQMLVLLEDAAKVDSPPKNAQRSVVCIVSPK
ncbi:MAG: translation initiation factor IF-3 [Planctomycetaceae bacterium]|jgi:translation initiation factor IF-3|nr:translation initiation factor IF-3 [Planctomycetaceae bacterium]